jgi:hypothetical protein
MILENPITQNRDVRLSPNIISPMRILTVLCFLAASAAIAGTPAIEPGVYHETVTGMTLRYPVELEVLDAQKAIDEGHIAVFGSMQNEAKEHELAKQCMKPLLMADLPNGSTEGKQGTNANTATLLMFEFVASKECKAGFKHKDDESLAGGIAQTAIQLPGATPLSPPLWFDFGKQKLHATFAAIGLQSPSPDLPPVLMVMAAMRYHGHILGWMMFASKLNTFNDLIKSSIELDDGKIYPLVPFNLDDHLRLPINIVK